ncbi:uncharacterized protein LOC143916755 [Arctopsyche grandis]|uniref:uncharacterized protein LOC143916755 n=1 Tax=Arctopsyche grandis TaxID=121162 RepID=UPI00406D9AE2
MFFQIHEDTRYDIISEPLNHENKGIRIKLQNKLNVDVQHQEPRKVLGHVTNTRHGKILSRCPLESKKMDEMVETFESRNQNCEIVTNINHENIYPYEVDVESSPISIESSPSPQDVSMISINSVIPNEVESYRDRQLNLLYTESQYRQYIYHHLIQSESYHRPHPHYMNKQPELNDNMRCILLDWLVSISDEYEFASETLYLGISYIDRFLSKMSVVRSKLQLLGVTAMMIAAKYEEIHPPDILEFSSLTKETCTVKQILKMEQLVLRVLSFDLTMPTAQTFIDEFGFQGNLSVESVNIAMYISELCMVESVQYLTYLPSELAASSIALSRHTMAEEDMWPRKLEDISGYSLTTLYPIIKKQHQVFQDSPTKSLQAVRLKYGKDMFKRVSNLTPRKLL